MTIDPTMALSVYSGVLTLLIGVIAFFLTRTFKDLDGKVSIKEFETAQKDIEENKVSISKIKDNYLTKAVSGSLFFTGQCLKAASSLSVVIPTGCG